MGLWPEILWIELGTGQELHGKLRDVALGADGSSISIDCTENENFYTVRLVRDPKSGQLIGPIKKGRPGQECGQVNAIRYENQNAILLKADWVEDGLNYLWVVEIGKVDPSRRGDTPK
jgi:hypothetical protein